MIIKTKIKEFPITQTGLEILRKHSRHGFAILDIPRIDKENDETSIIMTIIRDCKKNSFAFSQLLIPLGHDNDGYNYRLVAIVYNHPVNNTESSYESGILCDFAIKECIKYGMESIYVREAAHNGCYLNAQGVEIESDHFNDYINFNEPDVKVYTSKPWCYTNRVRRGGYGEVFLDVKEK